MSERPDPQRGSDWFAFGVLALLALQLAFSWMHGRQLHQQRQELAALREDIQSLADQLDPSTEGESGYHPARYKLVPGHGRLVRVSDEPEDPAVAELRASQASAQKAVREARDVQSKLSIEENIRKAEARSKLEDGVHSWQIGLGAALAVGLVAFLGGRWLRRRG